LHHSRFRISAWLRPAVSAAALIAGNASCSETLLSAGPTPALAESRADQLFEAFAARFNSVELAPRYEAARLKLAQSALVPSRIFNDTTVWDARPSATTRFIYVNGSTPGSHYRLESHPSLLPAPRVGDTRHSIGLEQIASNVYRWSTNVDLTVGNITAENVSVLISALLNSPESRAEHELRNDYRAAFPRAMASLGRGFTVDTIRTGPGGAATISAVTLNIGSVHGGLKINMVPGECRIEVDIRLHGCGFCGSLGLHRSGLRPGGPWTGAKKKSRFPNWEPGSADPPSCGRAD